LVFICGVHGVGKTHFCKYLSNLTGMSYYSASSLIQAKRQKYQNKLVASDDLIENQFLLIDAVADLKKDTDSFLLDGHLCLLDKDGGIQQIPIWVFFNLRPDAIILLTEAPEIIKTRLKKRDNKDIDLDIITEFQAEEILYAHAISSMMNIRLFEPKTDKDTKEIVEYLLQYGNDR